MQEICYLNGCFRRNLYCRRSMSQLCEIEVCCVSTDLDIENSLKERFCFWQSINGLRISRSNSDFVCCESENCQIEERVGFEPTDRFRPSVFKTDAIDRSAISPTSFLLAQRGWWSITINPKRSLNLPTAVSSSWFKPLGILASPMRALSLCTRDFSDSLTRYQGCSLPIDL